MRGAWDILWLGDIDGGVGTDIMQSQTGELIASFTHFNPTSYKPAPSSIIHPGQGCCFLFAKSMVLFGVSYMLNPPGFGRQNHVGCYVASASV